MLHLFVQQITAFLARSVYLEELFVVLPFLKTSYSLEIEIWINWAALYSCFVTKFFLLYIWH